MTYKFTRADIEAMEADRLCDEMLIEGHRSPAGKQYCEEQEERERPFSLLREQYKHDPERDW